ncbi:MAG: hypothetical protein ACFFG0_03030 [Candidatus Thorarchaeota archaeon]
MRTTEEVLNGMSMLDFLNKCKDFKFFCENLLGLTKEGGIHDYQIEWFNMVMNNNYVMIQAPSGFSKTTIFEAIAIYIVWNNRDKKVMIIANTDKRAKTIISDIDTFIGENEIINNLKPKDYRETWNKEELRTSTGCKIFCKPYTPNMRGERSDFTLVDEADAEAYGDVKIFKEHVLTRLNPGSKISLISTPDSTTGLMSYLRDTDKDGIWVFKRYEAIVNMKVKGDYTTGTSLWKERFPLKVLLERKDLMGDAFEKVYMCNEKAEMEDSLFKTKYLIDCYDNRFGFQQKSEGGLVIIGCDFAYSDSTTADDTVFVIIEKLRGVYIIRNIKILPTGSDLPTKVEEIKELFEQYKFKLDKEGNCLEPIIVCDGSNIGSDVVNELYTQGYAVVSEPFSAPRRKDMYRVLQNIVENKKLVIPREPTNEETIKLTNLLKEQLLGFYEKKSQAGGYHGNVLVSGSSHDDIAAALALAINEGVKQIDDNLFEYDEEKEIIDFDMDKRMEWNWNKL